ncbi:MAG: GGDEF domain-containing protein [Phycisphaeraceae bacterium]|nr:GGDEF domain-containing protein [Phycisphaeraceae bacterium]
MRGGSHENGADGASRVILVGRTGLDQSLRSRPEVELLRVKSTLEAIGELSMPIDELSPTRTAIVVGADVITDERAATEFARAARSVAPGVVLISSGELAGAEFDGGASTDEDVVRMLRFGSGKRGSPVARGGSEDRAPSAGRDATKPGGVESLIASILSGGPERTQTESRRGSSVAMQGQHAKAVQGPHDIRMVECLLRGHDVLEVGLELLRNRLGTSTLSFIPVSAATNGGAEAPGGAAPVAYGRALMGFLVAPGIETDALSPHASWLATWLRLRDQQSELRHAAFTDPTSGAWNRRYFDRFLASAIEDCRGSRRTLTLMVFDIDDFKQYNDNHGHGAGDEILSEIVRLMKSVVRPTDRVCRIGGDEFGVIFHEPDGPREANSRHPDSVCKIAQRFQQQVGRHRFPKLGSQAPGSLSISGGLATFPWDGSTAEQLLERADARALESKRTGKNALTLGPSAIRREE